MADERRYEEDEVKQILDLATRASGSGGPAASSGEGLTLAELEQIGREVGLEPERIAEAATALDGRGTALARRSREDPRPRRGGIGQSRGPGLRGVTSDYR